MCELRKQSVEIWRKFTLQYDMSHCMTSAYVTELSYSVGRCHIPDPAAISCMDDVPVEPNLVPPYSLYILYKTKYTPV